MSASVPHGDVSEASRRPSPPAGAPGTERNPAHELDAEQFRAFVNPYPSHDDRVKHWSEQDRLAFLRRAQQEGR